jgi:hypothetical protein
VAVFVPSLNGLKVAMEFTDVTGDQNVNTFWVKNTAAWSSTSITTMLNAFITWFGTGDGTHYYKLYMSTNCALTAVTGRDFTTQHGLSVVSQTGLPAAGTGGAGAIAAGTTFCITSRTGIAGKSYRGRTYLAGVEAAALVTPDLGVIASSFADAQVAAFGALPAAVTAAIATCTLVVNSQYYQPGGPNTPSVPRATAIQTPITSFGYADLFVDFQRRRAPGHARHR